MGGRAGLDSYLVSLASAPLSTETRRAYPIDGPCCEVPDTLRPVRRSTRRGLVALALVTAGCAGSSSPSTAPSVPSSTTSTTSVADVALAAAKEACRLGANTRTGVDTLRTALALRGEDASGLSNEAVVQRWGQIQRQIGEDAAYALQERADVQESSGAAEAAAKAAALDPRWEQLHRGLSNYATYVRGRGRGANPSGLDRWLEDIRLGCERVRALGGS